MQECILNMLPLRGNERAEFESIAPDAEHMYAGRRTCTLEQVQRATVIFGWIRPRMLAQAENLRWFQTMWAGTDEYEGFVPEGALFTSSSGSNSRSVAEHMLACTLSLFRRLPAYRDSQGKHRWLDEGKCRTLLDSSVLVVGAGNVGTEYARLCRSLGARTVGVKRTVSGPVDGFDEVQTVDKLDSLLPRADVVALFLPHSPATAGLMDARRIALMKDDAVLLNAGRGSVLDQNALAEAMKAGKLWGAALDVTDPEPLPEDSPLWDIPNLLLTPHVAGGMRLELTRRTCIQMAQDNLRLYLAGRPLKNLVRR